MFFYLSFLRPPPQSVYIGSNAKGNFASKSIEITFTPQIANDLRIAFLEEAIDIFYSWIRVSSPGAPAITNGQSNSIVDSFQFMGPKIKLTTWHVSSMYKALSVPFPHTGARGEEWRLALFCQSPTSVGSNIPPSKNSFNSVIIDLTKRNLGNLPFPVFSMPIRIENDFSAPSSLKKNKGKGNITLAKTSGKETGSYTAKQSQIERFYLIPAPSQAVAHNILDSSANSATAIESNPANSCTSTVICLREDTSFDLDKKIWDSGLMLSSWLSQLFITHEKAEDIINPLKTRLWKRIYSGNASSRIRILELGCGTGIVSICLAALFNRFCSERFTEVFASDQASAISIINHNISVNKHAFPSVDIKPLILDWDCDCFPPEAAMPFDLVIMADVTYNTASFPSLVRTICNLVKQPPDMASDNDGEAPVSRPYVLMAYKQREEAERSLWGMLEEKGVVLILIDKITAQCGVQDNDCSNSGSGFGVDEEIEIWAWFP